MIDGTLGEGVGVILASPTFVPGDTDTEGLSSPACTPPSNITGWEVEFDVVETLTGFLFQYHQTTKPPMTTKLPNTTHGIHFGSSSEFSPVSVPGVKGGVEGDGDD